MLLSYSDVVLKQTEFSQFTTRGECDTKVVFANRQFRSPVCPANMSCCIDLETYTNLILNGYFAILHRFSDDPAISPPDFVFEQVLFMQKLSFVSISVGTSYGWRQLIDKLAKEQLKVDCITIDIANGWSVNMMNMVKYIKKILPNTFIIGGNIPCGKAALDLESWGCGAVKAGYGMGAGCRTFTVTGIGTPMFSTILDIASVANVPIIADGGVRCGGDIAKAIVAGASMVMVGSLFAACKDSPAPLLDGKKLYFGSASQRQKGHSLNVEGKEVLLNINNDTYLGFLDKTNQGLRSAMSYLNKPKIEFLPMAQWEEIKTPI